MTILSAIRKVLKINGADRSFICDPQKDTLADVIRNLGLTGTKVGCDAGQCGACNVILNGKLTRSCVKKISAVADYSTIYTIEGLGTADNLHPIQLAWIVYGGVQCGFCTPGFIVSTKALLDENPNPTREEVRAWFQKNRNACRCTGYKPLVDCVMAAAKVLRGEMTMAELAYKAPADGKIFNTDCPKPTALGKVLGAVDYGDDIALKVPGMLHLALVMPNISHGLIKSIDTSEAEKAPGVFKVITSKDVKGTNRLAMPIGSAWAIGDGTERPIICDQKIFRLGDVVAVVAAETRRQAREAVKLVKVDYEPLPEYLNALDAVREDAVQLHPGIPNLFIQKPLFKGEDTRTVFPKAAHVAEFSVATQRQPHFPIEPDTGNAFIDADGTVTILYKTHGVHMAKNLIAQGIGVPREKVRVILNPSGGAFGYSLSAGTPALLGVCVLATGRPVSLTLTYEEHQLFTGKRAATYSNARLACDENGKLMAGELHILVDKGNNSEFASSYLNSMMKFFCNMYNIPNARVLAGAVYTNTPYVTAYRCPAAMETYTNCEQLVDMLAEKAGLDPLEFRYRNIWREDDCDPIWGGRPPVFVIPGMLDTLRPKYVALKAHAEKNTTPEKPLGVGIALGSYKVSSHGDHAEVALELNADGKFTVYNTWEDMGQGADIGSLAIAHEALRPLGVSAENIRLVMNDTANCPDTGFAGSSRSNIMVSLSTRKAADMLMAAMRKADGTYRTYDEMVAENIPTKYVGVHDWPKNPDASELIGSGSESPDQSYCSFVAEVEVDVNTGKTKVLELHCVADLGVTTNILSLEGQAYSGMLHGTGYALSEEFSDFKKHTSLIGGGFPYIETMPDGEHFTLTNIGTPRDYSPFGGSGCSEGLQSAAHAAILNAIYKAVGIRVKSTPAKPEKVKQAIAEKKNGTYQPQEKFYLGVDFDEKLDDMKANPPGTYRGAATINH
jgi:aldehyde oxidoreductase